MHRFEFEKRAEKTLKNTLNLLLNKSRDYAPEDDIYHGMKLCENLGICTLEKGILVRMTDKIGRLSNLIDHIKVVHNESTLDTVRDLLGYACLLYVYMEKNKEEADKQEKVKEHEAMVDNALKGHSFADSDRMLHATSESPSWTTPYEDGCMSRMYYETHCEDVSPSECDPICNSSSTYREKSDENDIPDGI